MKRMLLGIAFILFGNMCLVFSYLGSFVVFDMVGIGLAIMGMILSIVGFLTKDK